MAQAGATFTTLGTTPRKNPPVPSFATIFFIINPTRASEDKHEMESLLFLSYSLPSAYELT